MERWLENRTEAEEPPIRLHSKRGVSKPWAGGVIRMEGCWQKIQEMTEPAPPVGRWLCASAQASSDWDGVQQKTGTKVNRKNLCRRNLDRPFPGRGSLHYKGELNFYSTSRWGTNTTDGGSQARVNFMGRTRLPAVGAEYEDRRAIQLPAGPSSKRGEKEKRPAGRTSPAGLFFASGRSVGWIHISSTRITRPSSTGNHQPAYPAFCDRLVFVSVSDCGIGRMQY